MDGQQYLDFDEAMEAAALYGWVVDLDDWGFYVLAPQASERTMGWPATAPGWSDPLPAPDDPAPSAD